MKEQAVLFGEFRSLVGILTNPCSGHGSPKPGVILLNPGIVHRVAPGRLYVKLARDLASLGFAVLRFDFSGIGDSVVRRDHLPFERSAVREAQEAMDWLNAATATDRFVLLGGCSGAQIALRTACCDPRVVGAILINLPLLEAGAAAADAERQNRRAAYHYWNFALFDLTSWRKFLSGRVNYRGILQALRSQAKGRFRTRKKLAPEALEFREQLRQLAGRDVHLIFAYSQDDLSRNDLHDAGGEQLERLRASGSTTIEIIPRADHTFSSLSDQERLLKVIRCWIGSVIPRVINRARVFDQLATSHQA